jgi:hypothetical protein
VTLLDYISIRIAEETKRGRSPMSLGRVEAFKEIAKVVKDLDVEVEDE